MLPAIADATKQRRLLRFRYRGTVRLVLPMAYGVGRAGDELLRAWQIAGPLASGQTRGWKLFRVAVMSEVNATSGSFTAAEIPPDFNPDDPLMVRVLACCTERMPMPYPLRNSRRSRS